MSVVPDSLPALGADTAHVLPGGVRALDTTVVEVEIARLIAHALSQRPDLAERSATVRQSQAQVSAARREALPNPVLRGVLEQPLRSGGSTGRAGIGFTLPFLNRGQGDRQALRAAVVQAELSRAALTATVRAEVASAVASYRSASSEVQVLEATVLQPARQNRRLVEIAYREGEVGLPVLLLIQNQAVDAELDYWSAWLAAREAISTLREATAQNIEDLRGSNGRTPR